MQIGHLSLVIRANGKHTWFKYLIPRNTQGKIHPYFLFGIWWLCFAIYYPRKCDCCHKFMTGAGGKRKWDNNKVLGIYCKDCYPKML